MSRKGNAELRLNLTEEQTTALVVLLRSLEGTPVDAKVAAPPR